VSNREVEGLGATVGTTADAAAASTGWPVEVLAPETSLSYELTLRHRSRRLKADLTAFQTDIHDNVAKQSLILPPGAVGLPLAREPITRQLPSGVVYVAVSSNPVLVRTNFDAARIRGLEATLDAELGRRSSWAGASPGSMPRTARLRFAPSGGRRFWVEPYLHAAARQERLSTLDLGDRRTGASRSRSTIASFFTNGALARGLVSSGPDGIRGALRFASGHEILVDLENLGDESYRGISWGLDAPGRGAYVRYSLRF
jgi:hemoglobin/transferrin/lactoferrin receptor protein